MYNLGMELNPVETTFIISNRGKRRTIGRGHSPETRRQGCYPITMAHPHLLDSIGSPSPIEQTTTILHPDKGPAKLPMIRPFDMPTQLGHHGLLTIADPQNRQPHCEQVLRGTWRTRPGHRSRTAGQDNPCRTKLPDTVSTDPIERVYFTVNTTFTHTPGDQLGYLGSKINNKNAVSHGFPYRYRARIDGIGADLNAKPARSPRLFHPCHEHRDILHVRTGTPTAYLLSAPPRLNDRLAGVPVVIGQ